MDFAGLQAAVVAMLHRTDLAAQVPAWIALAEAQMNRRIMVRRKIIRSTASISTEYVDMPSDFGGAVRTLRLTDTPNVRLVNISPEQMADKKAGIVPTGRPREFAIVGQELEFWPVPDGPYDAELAYYQNIPVLSISNTTNWVLANHPDAYLYGTLLQSAPFIGDDDRLPMWTALFKSILDDISAQSLTESMAGNLQMTPGAAAI